MAVKVKFQITLSKVIDVEAIYRYYMLKSSTSASPSKPTTYPPSSDWSDSEPSYTSGSTNTLYVVDCNVFSDGTWMYTNVCKSTAYEAAKEAYNKATNAQTTANTVKNDLANNYTKKTLPDTRNDNQLPSWYISNYPKQIITEFKYCSVIGLSGVGTYCTLQTFVPWNDKSGGYPKQTAKVDGTGKEFWRVGTSESAWSSWIDSYGLANTANTTANTARNEAAAAAKTATNYLNFSSDGLVVGDMTANTLGKNVLIDSDSVDIRNGSTVLASFGEALIELGKKSSESIISFCGGNATMTATKDDSTGYYDGIKMDLTNFKVDSQNIYMLTTMNGNDSNYNRIMSTTRSSDNTISNDIDTIMKYNGKQYNSYLGTYSSADSSEQTTWADMHADHYTGSSWKRNWLKVTPTETTLSDMSNSGLIRPWQKTLWTGAWYMVETQTITLSEAISAQPHGIVLLFREYVDGVSKNSGLHTYYVPKTVVADGAGWGHSISWAHHNGNYYICKYLYINDTTIKGNTLNNDSGTTMSPSGITPTNNRIILWKVYGV